MKLIIVIAAVFATCLLFLSSQASVAFAKPLSSSPCDLIAADGCAGTEAPANPDRSSETMQFAGAFTNTQVNVSGQITIEITLNDDDTIEGNVNFSQFSAGQFTCGSGDFEGSKTGEMIELHFTSNSPDPACGFNQGVTFTIEAALLNNTIIRGDYSTDTGQQGIVELRRISPLIGVYMPLMRK